MAKKGLITTSDLERMRVRGGKSGRKNIGRVKTCVFHPKEKRCIGFIVKRPDLLWMFHRKDVFVALDEFEFVDGRIVDQGGRELADKLEAEGYEAYVKAAAANV